ncbi:hypothetical protein WMY93_021389 [Mugilogobius chulae]|uniref:Uncharacterized protein n=1 Tax=Mugilogobius chulae TaxID=88201 RepID=A0AAW0NLS2_9GOBI
MGKSKSGAVGEVVSLLAEPSGCNGREISSSDDTRLRCKNEETYRRGAPEGPDEESQCRPILQDTPKARREVELHSRASGGLTSSEYSVCTRDLHKEKKSIFVIME